jgi:ketosteroid isomerase-like protein
MTSDIQALEDQLTLASRHIDLAALDRLYADDIIDEARRGIAERQKASGASAPSYEKDDLNVVVHGDTGVASYRVVVTFRHDGQDLVRRFRTTNVWMKRPAGWQVVAAHTATLEGAAGL